MWMSATNTLAKYLDPTRFPKYSAEIRQKRYLNSMWSEGRMEAVMVVADGFAWNGEIFASLSAVAKAITGTKWNGHRFFGVRPEDRSIVGPKLIGGGAPSNGSKIVPRASGGTS